ncbi:bardet-Biedl syndrome 10 protein [Nephila pilipes]|uniref:Bardet-Biedl syndrome 10 protein n=1 Tax=Nephila pilipes TaxID=299642 RepID=A0A8X6MD98_NEPPI|nr:bardet-Biedl syndrome 10 protein [Nephila pilipes]
MMQSVSLKQIVTCCDALGSFVDAMLDPYSMALVVGKLEGMVFTRQASRILCAIEWKHPLEKIILDTISLYREKTGDDCKIFILLLKELMKSIKDKLETTDETQLRRTISEEVTCLVTLLPTVFENVRNTFARYSLVEFHSFPKDLEGLILTFFHSKFSPNVSLKLTQLICSFLSFTISNSNHAIESLSYLILNFNVFCSKVILPLSHSVVLEGFAFTHRLLSSHEGKDIFVVVQELPQNFHDVICGLNSESHLLQFWDSVEISLKYLKSKEISLILTSNRASDNFESLCSQYKILIIDGITKEDMDNILFFVDISPLVTLKDPLLPQNLGYVKTLKSVVVGNVSFAYMKIFSGCLRSMSPNHIILCAPMEDVWKDYYSECHNCLKVVRQWLHPHFNDLKYSGTKVNDEKIKEKCMKMQDKLKNSLLSDVLKSTVPYEKCASISAFGVAFPMGLFEFSLKIALAGMQENKLLCIKTLYDLLESALLRVICKLWNTTIPNLEHEKSYVEFYEKIKKRISIPIEPASSKEHLVYMILQLIQQLMKIDTILCTK